MKTYLIDCYRVDDRIILWLKKGEENIRLEKTYQSKIFIDPKARNILDKKKIPYKEKNKKSHQTGRI